MITRQMVRQKLPSFSMPYSPSFERVSSREVAKNGVLTKSSIHEVYNPAEADKGVSYRDFLLANIQALDNSSLLNPCQMVESKIDGITNLKKFNDDVKAAVEKAQSN